MVVAREDEQQGWEKFLGQHAKELGISFEVPKKFDSEEEFSVKVSQLMGDKDGFLILGFHLDGLLPWFHYGDEPYWKLCKLGHWRRVALDCNWCDATRAAHIGSDRAELLERIKVFLNKEMTDTEYGYRL